MTAPPPEGRLSDKAVAYIESNLSKFCIYSHHKDNHDNRKGACQDTAADNCDEFKPTNGSRVWKEASERNETGRWDIEK